MYYHEKKEDTSNFSEQNIFNDIIQIIGEITSDWEMDFDVPIGLETYLGADMAFKSIDVVLLIAAIQKHYGEIILPFEELIVQGDQVKQDTQVSELVPFLLERLPHDF
jgi:acyl carrier protein